MNWISSALLLLLIVFCCCCCCFLGVEEGGQRHFFVLIIVIDDNRTAILNFQWNKLVVNKWIKAMFLYDNSLPFFFFFSFFFLFDFSSSFSSPDYPQLMMVRFFVVVIIAVCCLIPVSAAGRYTRFVAGIPFIWQVYPVGGWYIRMAGVFSWWQVHRDTSSCIPNQ